LPQPSIIPKTAEFKALWPASPAFMTKTRDVFLTTARFELAGAGQTEGVGEFR
jgi:hypothetical protein